MYIQGYPERFWSPKMSVDNGANCDGASRFAVARCRVDVRNLTGRVFCYIVNGP